MAEDRAGAFLRMIRRSQRGRLKIYLGYCAGVGKTYQMLQEGHRLRHDGIDVVIGLLETHGRADIAELARDLEVIPRRRQDYRGITIDEMDVDAVLARKPQVALIDELAHTNVPGSRNAKRYEDVQDILTAGIHVISTLNVQHLESLYNIVENAVGIKVRERIPDSVVADADEIVDVDLATDDLRKRLEEGKIYPEDRIAAAMANFFNPANLEKLRELALRELASQIDLRRREAEGSESEAASDQVMVCLSSQGPNSERLLRYGSRLAGKLNRNWYAVYVQTPSEEARAIDARIQRELSESLTLAKQLGAMVFTYKGEDIAETILRFAREYRVGHIVIGRSKPRKFWDRFGRNKAIVESLIRKSNGVSVIVIDTSNDLPLQANTREAAQKSAVPETEIDKKGPDFEVDLLMSDYLTSSRIVIWDTPVDKGTVLKTLAEAAGRGSGIEDADRLFQDVLAREEKGSTFFNEGVAFPHVRVDGMTSPSIALGLTRAGITDVITEKKMETVFMMMSPLQAPDIQVKLLGLAGRAAQNRSLLQNLRSARTSGEVMEAIRSWETPQPN